MSPTRFSNPPRLFGLAPIADARTRVLILGSFPGLASLRAQQYYGHPRNVFWSLLGACAGEELAALDYEQRVARLLALRIGVWDVIAGCEREGSLDSAIRNEQVNDFAALFTASPLIERVAFNGAKAARYRRLIEAFGKAVVVLPSSSPANAGTTVAQKRERWMRALDLCRPCP